MAIKLNVEEYCQNCPEFEADIEKCHYTWGWNDTFIYCKHKERCEIVKNFLHRKSEERHDESSGSDTAEN
jgi:hypothetical protein